MTLLGAFRYGDQLIPVQFGLKRQKNDQSHVYIVATIKNEDVIKTECREQENLTPTTLSATPSSEFSIQQIMDEAKEADEGILSNLPYQIKSSLYETGK